MTGNIIVSTCCLGDMAVNAPSALGCALGLRGVYSHIATSQTCANYYLMSEELLYHMGQAVFFYRYYMAIYMKTDMLKGERG